MTYDHELTLISQTYTDNDIGDPISTESQTVILCGLKSVGRSEFYQAAARDLNPVAVFVVHSYEYSGEELVMFEGVRYKVIRTYGTGVEELELSCEKAAGNHGST